jgi:hypothetical protein
VQVVQLAVVAPIMDLLVEQIIMVCLVVLVEFQHLQMEKLVQVEEVVTALQIVHQM